MNFCIGEKIFDLISAIMPAKKTAKKSTSVSASSSTTAVAPPAGFMPPGGPIEIVFSFDTTGSMSGVLGEVRKQVQEVIKRLFTDIPGLKISVFAHGDYCDSRTYVTKCVDFTNDAKKLCHFVQTVKSTGGGDWEECYELVLRQVRENLSWTPGTQRALVMIGDAIPHGTSYAQNKDKIDWKQETNKLYKEMGVRIYAVQAGKNSAADHFWKDLAKMSDGKHLDLEQFNTIIDMIMAICYRETGPDFFEAYEREVRAREGAGIRSELDNMFDALRDPAAEASGSTSAAAADTTTTTITTPAKRARTGAAKKKAPAAAATAIDGPRKGTKRPRDDDDDDDSTDGVTTRAKKAKVMPKKPWPLKKTSSSIVAYKLVKKAKLVKPKKHRRETVPQTRFALNKLQWSAWHSAMAAKAPSDEDETWCPRRGEHNGVRNTRLFQNDTECPAVYEFAVQARQRCKKYPIYFSTTRGFSRQNWDTYLLKQQEVTDEVDEVLKKGCKLFVRRAKVEKPVNCEGKVLSSVDELRALIAQTYDYAWTAPRHVRDTHRQVTRNGILISNRSA